MNCVILSVGERLFREPETKDLLTWGCVILSESEGSPNVAQAIASLGGPSLCRARSAARPFMCGRHFLRMTRNELCHPERRRAVVSRAAVEGSPIDGLAGLTWGGPSSCRMRCEARP